MHSADEPVSVYDPSLTTSSQLPNFRQSIQTFHSQLHINPPDDVFVARRREVGLYELRGAVSLAAAASSGVTAECKPH